jgi:hypothetical protein
MRKKEAVARAGKTDGKPDKFKMLERAHNEKQLSDNEYEMWKHVYEMQEINVESDSAPVSRKKHRRSI